MAYPIRSLLLVPCLLTACVAAPENVVENSTPAPLEVDGEPSDGPPVFEVVAQAEIDPPYDRSEHGSPLKEGVRLWHCGAVSFPAEDEVRVPEGTLDIADVGAVVHVDYDDFAEDYGLYLGGAGPFTLSLLYDLDGNAASTESDTWDFFPFERGTFLRPLDFDTPLFRIDPGDPPMLTVLDPDASYDADTQTLTTSYGFITETGSEHTVSETYVFGGRHLQAVQTPPWVCD